MATKKTDEREVLEQEQKALVVKAQALVVIKTAKDYDDAKVMLGEVYEGKDRALDFIEPQRESAKKTYDIILEQKRKLITPYDELINALKGGISQYELEMEEKITKARERAEEKAEAETELARDEIRKKIAQLEKKREKLKSPEALLKCNEEIKDLQEELGEVEIEPDHVGTVPKSKGSTDDIVPLMMEPVKFLKWLTKGKKPKIAIDAVITWKLGAVKTHIKNTGEVPDGIDTKKTKIIKRG